MERAYLQALSVVVSRQLRYVAIVVTNARCIDARTVHYHKQERYMQQRGKIGKRSGRGSGTSSNSHGNSTTGSISNTDFDEAVASELASSYYLCIGKHSLSILDSKMIGSSGSVAQGGYLARVPFRALHQVYTCSSEANGFSLEIDPALAETPPYCQLPASIYMRSGSTERIVQQLQICWKADCMYRTLRVLVC